MLHVIKKSNLKMLCVLWEEFLTFHLKLLSSSDTVDVCHLQNKTFFIFSFHWKNDKVF